MYDQWWQATRNVAKLNKARGIAIADNLTDLIDAELAHDRRPAKLRALVTALKDILEITATTEE